MSDVAAPAAAAPSTSSSSTPQTSASTSPPSSPVTGSGNTQGGGAAKTHTPPAASPSEMFEVKVNGKMVKMTRQEVLDNASMSYAANDRFNESKKLRSDVDKIITTAKTNPIQALMDPALGLTKDQIRDAFESWYHKEYIEPSTLSEDQRKNRELETQLKKYQEEEKLQKQKAEQDEEQKLTNQQRDYLQKQIVDAMESSGLPKTKFFASRMAFYMRQNAMNGWEAPIDMIVKQVKNERQSIMSDMSDGASAEQLISLLGDGVINKIRQHDLKQLREKRSLPPASSSVSPSRAGTGPLEEKVNYQDVSRRLRDMRR